MNGPANRFDVEPNVYNHFAWIRTAISLIGFGFTIVQFFQRLQETGTAAVRRPEAPRDLGLALIGAGMLALAIAAYQYRQSLLYLWQDQFYSIAGMSEKPHRTPTFLVAMVLLLIGLFAFGSVFFRMT